MHVCELMFQNKPQCFIVLKCFHCGDSNQSNCNLLFDKPKTQPPLSSAGFKQTFTSSAGNSISVPPSPLLNDK